MPGGLSIGATAFCAVKGSCRLILGAMLSMLLLVRGSLVVTKP